MTLIWTLILALGGLVGVAAYVWLLVIAFKESAAWGVACLLVPLAAVVFAIRHWELAKLAFVASLVGCLVTVVGAVGYSMTKVNQGIEEYSDLGTREAWEPPPAEPSVAESLDTPPDEPESSDVTPDVTEDETQDEVLQSASDLVQQASKDNDLSVLDGPVINGPPPRPNRDGELVPIQKLGELKGERVVLILNTLERVSAYVVGADDTEVTLRHRVGGGSVTYTIELADIKEARSRASLSANR